jgi:AcrR family transcriptional regulator
MEYLSSSSSTAAAVPAAAAAADETRPKLLEAAGQVFAAKGFDSATIREICRQAGANVAAVNYHFRDKETLYFEAVAYAHQCLRFQAALAWPDDVPPERRLGDFIRGLLDHLLDPQRPDWHAQLMMRELAHPTQACRKLVEEFIRPVAGVLRQILADLLPESVPQTERWRIAFSVVSQCIFYRTHRPVIRLLLGDEEFAGWQVESLADHVTRFCLAALGKGPAVTAAREGAAP